MADPTVTQVLTDAAALLGDITQEQFNNSVLMPWYGFAFRELYDICQRWRLPMGQRTAYALVPVLTNMFVPESAGIADFGQPIGMQERTATRTVTITNVTDATPMVVTTSGAHGFTSGAEAEITGVVGPVAVNDQWFITVLSPTTFSLNGSYAGGAYGSGGTAIQSDDTFFPMTPTDQILQIEPIDVLQYFTWRNNRFYFPGSTTVREIMITYTSSGNAPAAGNVGVDDSRSYLAMRTASLVASQYDMAQSAQRLTLEALGPSMTADGTGGALRNLVGPMLLEKQLTVKRPGTFRPRRNGMTGILW